MAPAEGPLPLIDDALGPMADPVIGPRAGGPIAGPLDADSPIGVALHRVVLSMSQRSSHTHSHNGSLIIHFTYHHCLLLSWGCRYRRIVRQCGPMLAAAVNLNEPVPHQQKVSVE